METLISLCMGITLSAACGFRLFIPPLILSISAIYGHVELAPEFHWLATTPAMITLAIATVVEISAYYIPVVDNFLDTIAIPTALAIGTMLTSASLGDVDPVLRWTIAVIAGGTAAEVIQAVSSTTRLASTGFTGGSANFLVSTTEGFSSIVLSLLALSLPFLAIILVVVLLVLALKKLRYRWDKRRKEREFRFRQEEI